MMLVLIDLEYVMLVLNLYLFPKHLILERLRRSSMQIKSTKDSNLQTACVLEVDGVATLPVLESKPLFLEKNWRDSLCRCDECLDMYEQKRIIYLLDKEDSITDYEKMAKEKKGEKLQRPEVTSLAFSITWSHREDGDIGRIADFKEKFRSFLESFDTSKAISSSDVHQIFDSLAKKRRRTN